MAPVREMDRAGEPSPETLEQWLVGLASDTLASEGGADAAHDLDHVVRTMAIARRIQAHEGGELAVVLAATALHDIGQERERRDGGDHAAIGAGMAGDLLAGTRFPRHLIPAVQQAIREHRTTGGTSPRTLEGKILFDADKIDSLGAVGIARLYCIAGMHGQKVYAPVPASIGRPVSTETLLALRRRPDYSSSIEFALLLADLPDRFLTATGRAMAEERHAYMRGFFQRLQQEVEGDR
ncbi:MAG: HD domain-containing protein [Thermomicrobiales bacterium]